MKNKQFIPILAVTILFALSIGAYVITFKTVSSLQKESFQLDAEIQAATNKEKGAARLEETLAILSVQEEKLDQYVVSDTTVVDFLNSIEDLQNQKNIIIDIVSVAAKEEDGVFVLSMTVDGPFGEVVQTIGAISQMQTFVTLTGASLSTIVKKENDDELWTASLTYTVLRKT